MSSSGRMSGISLAQQRGFVFKLIHSLILVALIVGAILLYRAGKLPFIQYQPEWPGFGGGSNNAGNYIQTSQRDVVTRENETATLTSSRYAVQVAAGYDSRQLYRWRDALIRDGFDAYLVSLNTSRGVMFKLRVGAFNNRAPAERLRNRIINRYPNQGLFLDSFIVQGE